MPSTEKAEEIVRAVKRESDGLIFEVDQRVSFVDPQSGMYTDGIVVAIHGPKKIEVGYWRSSWSDPKYNRIVSIDTLLRIGKVMNKHKKKCQGPNKPSAHIKRDLAAQKEQEKKETVPTGSPSKQGKNTGSPQRNQANKETNDTASVQFEGSSESSRDLEAKHEEPNQGDTRETDPKSSKAQTYLTCKTCSKRGPASATNSAAAKNWTCQACSTAGTVNHYGSFAPGHLSSSSRPTSTKKKFATEREEDDVEMVMQVDKKNQDITTSFQSSYKGGRSHWEGGSQGSTNQKDSRTITMGLAPSISAALEPMKRPKVASSSIMVEAAETLLSASHGMAREAATLKGSSDFRGGLGRGLSSRGGDVQGPGKRQRLDGSASPYGPALGSERDYSALASAMGTSAGFYGKSMSPQVTPSALLHHHHQHHHLHHLALPSQLQQLQLQQNSQPSRAANFLMRNLPDRATNTGGVSSLDGLGGNTSLSMALPLASLSPRTRDRRVREAKEDMWSAASALCGIREDVEHRLRELQRLEALQALAQTQNAAMAAAAAAAARGYMQDQRPRLSSWGDMQPRFNLY